MRPGGVNDVMQRKRAQGIWGIWEKSVSWVFASEEDGWLSELAEALRRVPHVVGGQHRKIVYLSPDVKKPFNSKVIKIFVPELRGRKCFLCFEIPICYLYMSYEHSMYILHIHIWVCYIMINNIYHHLTLPRLKINANTLRKILLPYTTEVPFYEFPWKYIDKKRWNYDGVSFGTHFQELLFQPLKIRSVIPSKNLIVI